MWAGFKPTPTQCPIGGTDLWLPIERLESAVSLVGFALDLGTNGPTMVWFVADPARTSHAAWPVSAGIVAEGGVPCMASLRIETRCLQDFRCAADKIE
jgi:hypothetical protein